MNDLVMGQVAIVTSNKGNTVNVVEMLLQPHAKLKLEYVPAEDGQESRVDMTIQDKDMLSEHLSGSLDIDTLEDMIKVLSRLRNQLKGL